jgi:signal recognition particle subunit SRP54
MWEEKHSDKSGRACPYFLRGTDMSGNDTTEEADMSARADFTLDDFRSSLEQLTKMRPKKELLSNMPGLGEMILDGEKPETAFKRIQGIIDAMTEDERRNPDNIDSNRLHRIAIDSGTEPHEIEQFLDQFAQVRTIMRHMAQMSIWERIKMVTGFRRTLPP